MYIQIKDYLKGAQCGLKLISFRINVRDLESFVSKRFPKLN